MKNKYILVVKKCIIELSITAIAISPFFIVLNHVWR